MLGCLPDFEPSFFAFAEIGQASRQLHKEPNDGDLFDRRPQPDGEGAGSGSARLHLPLSQATHDKNQITRL